MAKDPGNKINKYAGLIAVLASSPVYFAFLYFGRADMGLTAGLSLGIILFTFYLRWDLSKHAWFWATVAVVLLLHVPLIVFLRWPKGWVPGITYLPFAVADCAFMLWLLRVVERLFTPKDSDQTGGQSIFSSKDEPR